MSGNNKARKFTLILMMILISIIYLPLASGNSSRPFQMVSTAVQMIPLSAEPFRNGTTDFPISSQAPEVDVVTICPEYLGIPYDVFANSPYISENHPWTIKMRQLITAANADWRPLMLELGLVRTGMFPRALDNNSQLSIDDSWAPVCYDFSQAEAVAVGDAFVNYAQWMAANFKPTYLVNFIEANLYYAHCGGDTPAWKALVSIQQRAYYAIKQVMPDIQVFPSFHLETLYNYQPDGWDENQYQAIAQMDRNRFGFSAYPFGIKQSDGHLITPYDLPADYLVRPLLRHPPEQLAISETGWNTVSIAIGDTSNCINDFPYSEERFAADYLSFVLDGAPYGKFDVVNWWSFRDEIPAQVLSTCYVRTNLLFAACNDEPWCMVINYMKDVTYQQSSELFSELVFKAFGAMGLKDDTTGQPKTPADELLA